MTGTLLWLVALAALSGVAAIVLRRMGALAGGTRELQRLQQDLAGIDRRLTTVVDPLVGRLDEVRRGASDPAELVPEVNAARTALRALAKEARTVKAPPALSDRVQQLLWELDRGVRAADMAGHGVTTLAASRSRTASGTEAHVALKRGTLGLRHAREAVARVVAGVESLSPAEVRSMPTTGAGRFAGIATPDLDEDLVTTAEEPPLA
ncbi:MAG TPA: hypothetical protein VIR16_08440 [Candidatus Limnocylindrales bacterium]